MTSLLCWIGVDARGPASAYIATDSRISWRQGETWDYGRKTFASASSPDLFGYCGDVLFASIALSQFVSGLDARLQGGSFANRFAALEQLVRVSFAAVPVAARNPFEIVHCGRDGDGMDSTIRAAVLSWRAHAGFERVFLPSPDHSAAIYVSGSGAASVRKRIQAWQSTEARNTSRVLFRGFVDALEQGLDSGSGGAPQLVGLYRIGSGLSFGVLYGGLRFLHGMPVHALAPDSALLWRNELFERSSGITRLATSGAQRHKDVVTPPG